MSAPEKHGQLIGFQWKHVATLHILGPQSGCVGTLLADIYIYTYTYVYIYMSFNYMDPLGTLLADRIRCLQHLIVCVTSSPSSFARLFFYLANDNCTVAHHCKAVPGNFCGGVGGILQVVSSALRSRQNAQP